MFFRTALKTTSKRTIQSSQYKLQSFSKQLHHSSLLTSKTTTSSHHNHYSHPLSSSTLPPSNYFIPSLPLSTTTTISAIHTLSSLPFTTTSTQHHNHHKTNQQLQSQSFQSTPIVNSQSMSSSSTTTTPTYCGIIPQTIKIDTIRCFSDNNCYVLRDNSGYITLVDPAEPENVIKGLDALGIDLTQKDVQTKTQILTTHHHWDHAGGNDYFANKYKHLHAIIGGSHDNIPFATKTVEHGEIFTHGDYTFTSYHTPCHTKGHICYFFHQTQQPQNHDNNNEQQQQQNEIEYGIFTGDTLFSAGCGKFFEGTAEQMFKNMTFFTTLPSTTFIYDGHEYTKSNLSYCFKCEPENHDIQQQFQWVYNHPNINTHPTTIGLEKKVNCFMRANSVEVLHQLRENKNKGKEYKLTNDEIRTF